MSDLRKMDRPVWRTYCGYIRRWKGGKIKYNIIMRGLLWFAIFLKRYGIKYDVQEYHIVFSFIIIL